MSLFQSIVHVDPISLLSKPYFPNGDNFDVDDEFISLSLIGFFLLSIIRPASVRSKFYCHFIYKISCQAMDKLYDHFKTNLKPLSSRSNDTKPSKCLINSASGKHERSQEDFPSPVFPRI